MNRRTLFRLTLGALVAPFLPSPTYYYDGHNTTFDYFGGDGSDLGRVGATTADLHILMSGIWEPAISDWINTKHPLTSIFTVAASDSERPVNRG